MRRNLNISELEYQISIDIKHKISRLIFCRLRIIKVQLKILLICFYATASQGMIKKINNSIHEESREG